MKSPLTIGTDVQEFFPDGTPKRVQCNPQDLLWIKGEATKEFVKLHFPFQLEGMREPFTVEDARIYAIAFATMRWMHMTGILKEQATISFKSVPPDLSPIDDPDWSEEKPDER